MEGKLRKILAGFPRSTGGGGQSEWRSDDYLSVGAKIVA